jgi:hypothetical protein
MRRNPAPTVVRGLLHPAAGPLVRVGISNMTGVTAKGVAVLDTGASMSALDRSIAAELALESFGVADFHALAAGEARHVAPQRRARVRIADDPRLWELDLVELPNLRHAVEGYEVLALLGWDFLDQCLLTCDGPTGMFSLTLPTTPRP